MTRSTQLRFLLLATLLAIAGAPAIGFAEPATATSATATTRPIATCAERSSGTTG